MNIENKNISEILNSFKTSVDLIDYCDKNMIYLNKGCGRRVYKIPNLDFVIKIGKVQSTQNKNEIRLYNLNYNKNIQIITKIYDYDKKSFKWIIQEYCQFPYSHSKNKIFDEFSFNNYQISFSLLTILSILCTYDIFLQNVCRKKDLFIEYIKDIKEKIPGNLTSFHELIRYTKEKYIDLFSDIRIKHYIHFLCITLYYRINKIDINQLFDYIFNKKYTTIPFIVELQSFVYKYNIVLLDFSIQNFGITKRNDKKYLVLLDYGVQEQIN